jgi:two-component system, response regulator RegA
MASDKVLLVDDEVEFVETLAERMRTRGLEVDYTHSGDGAVEKASKNHYDAIVLDLAMPGMDGMETLRHLRTNHPDLQIILLTGQGTIQTAVEATKLGAMDFLEKPTDIDQLLDKIKSARVKRMQLDEKRAAEDIENILSRRGW